MFGIYRLILKCLSLVNFVFTFFYKIYLLLFKQVDIAFLAHINILQLKNIRLGKYSTVEAGCILEAAKDAKIVIGKNVYIQRNTYLLSYGGKGIWIGDNTRINKDCILYGYGGLVIGKDCIVGPKCVFVSSSHIHTDTKKPVQEQGVSGHSIKIGDNVWTGASVNVLEGVVIGNNSIVGAGAVVNRSVEDSAVVAGVPARPLKKM